MGSKSSKSQSSDPSAASSKKKKDKKEKKNNKQQQQVDEPEPVAERPTSVASNGSTEAAMAAAAADVSLDPVDAKPSTKNDKKKDKKDSVKEKAAPAPTPVPAPAPASAPAPAKQESTKDESSDKLGLLPSDGGAGAGSRLSTVSTDSSNEGKKKRLSDNIANRMSVVEGTIGAQDSKEAQAVIDDAIERLNKNDPAMTELVINNSLFFLNAEKEARIAKQAKLAEAIQRNKTVVTVSLVHNNLDDEFAVAIAQALAQNNTVTTLSLESNNITGVGASALANMLTTNKTLRELRLNNQKFTMSTEGEEALMHAMESNETLIKLNLDIRDLGIRQSIEKNLSQNLDRVRKERYEATKDKIVVQLTDLQRKIMSIVSDNYEGTEADFSMDMEFTKLKEEEKVALAAGIANNTRIKVLKANKCGLRDSFVEELGRSLPQNRVIEVISLESNSITGTGVVGLAAGLKENESLKELRLQGQTAAISTEGEEALAAALDQNKTLLKLGLQIRNPTARDRVDKALRRNNDLVRQQRQRASMASSE